MTSNYTGEEGHGGVEGDEGVRRLSIKSDTEVERIKYEVAFLMDCKDVEHAKELHQVRDKAEAIGMMNEWNEYNRDNWVEAGTKGEEDSEQFPKLSDDEREQVDDEGGSTPKQERKKGPNPTRKLSTKRNRDRSSELGTEDEEKLLRHRGRTRSLADIPHKVDGWVDGEVKMKMEVERDKERRRERRENGGESIDEEPPREYKHHFNNFKHVRRERKNGTVVNVTRDVKGTATGMAQGDVRVEERREQLRAKVTNDGCGKPISTTLQRNWQKTFEKGLIRHNSRQFKLNQTTPVTYPDERKGGVTFTGEVQMEAKDGEDGGATVDELKMGVISDEVHSKIVQTIKGEPCGPVASR